MDNTKKIMAVLTFVGFCVFTTITLYKWIRLGTLDSSALFFSFVALAYFFTSLNAQGWRGEEERKKARRIRKESAQTAYALLMFAAGLLLFFSEGVTNLNKVDNYPLLFLVGLTLVILPITEFFYGRKYK